MYYLMLNISCLHNKTKYKCNECYPYRVCLHNKNRYKCKLCVSLFHIEKTRIKNLAKITEEIRICEYDINRLKEIM